MTFTLTIQNWSKAMGDCWLYISQTLHTAKLLYDMALSSISLGNPIPTMRYY